MLSCKQVSLLLSQAQDRRLGTIERWRLRLHLRFCDGCTNFRRQLEFMRRAIGRHPAMGAGEDPDDRQ